MPAETPVSLSVQNVALELLGTYPDLFPGEPGKLRWILEAKLVGNFRNAPLAGNQHVLGFGDHMEVNQLQIRLAGLLLQ